MADFMTVDMAKTIHAFLAANDIDRVNIMGGEFFCHPEWKAIIATLVDGMAIARLVTNGDWAASKNLATSVTGFLKGLPQIHVSISNDKWHENAHVDAASTACEEAGIPCNVEHPGTATDDTIVPVGRSAFEFGFYSMARYCANPKKTYGFLIDERGEICKCAMGILPYDDVENFVGGGFAARFKEMGTAFQKSFIMACADCARVAARIRSRSSGEDGVPEVLQCKKKAIAPGD